MGRKGITKQDVRSAMQKLSETERKATPTAIREVLGRGSYTTITDMLGQIKEDTDNTSVDLSSTVLPESIREQTIRAAEESAHALWSLAHNEAQKEVIGLRATYQGQLDSTKNELSEAIEYIASLEEERESLSKALEAAETKTLKKGEKLTAVQEENIRLTAEVKANGSTLSDMKTVLAKRDAEMSALIESIRQRPPSEEIESQQSPTRSKT